MRFRGFLLSAFLLIAGAPAFGAPGYIGAQPPAGPAVNAQTGTSYTVQGSDAGSLLTFNNASAVSVSLPQATGIFGASFAFKVQDLGAGSVTITPTTSTIGGASSLTLMQGQGAEIVSDGTNYQVRYDALGSAAFKSVGTSANNVVQLDGSGKLPAVDGSQLTNLSQVTPKDTVTTYTSGSGTYTVPAGTHYLRVRMVGGGGSGSTSGLAGGNTTFGTSLLTANGGPHGGTTTAPTATGCTVNLNGSVGPYYYDGTYAGAWGGSSPFGTGAIGYSSGLSNVAASGYGTGGFNLASGGSLGGWSGAYCESIITSPAASYAYAVGAGGTGTTNGSVGTGGLIIIEAF